MCSRQVTGFLSLLWHILDSLQWTQKRVETAESSLSWNCLLSDILHLSSLSSRRLPVDLFLFDRHMSAIQLSEVCSPRAASSPVLSPDIRTATLQNPAN